MVFIIQGMKWDTDKMERVAEVEKVYKISEIVCGLFTCKTDGIYDNKDCTLWKSINNRWLLTHEGDYGKVFGEAIEEMEAKELLKRYDYKKYEELYGKIPEA